MFTYFLSLFSKRSKTCQDSTTQSVKLETTRKGTWVAQLFKHLPSAYVMIPGSWDRVLNQAPCSLGCLLLPLPLPLLLCAPALKISLSLPLSSPKINKYNVQKKERKEERKEPEGRQWPKIQNS